VIIFPVAAPRNYHVLNFSKIILIIFLRNAHHKLAESARFQASTAKYIRYALFWATQHVVEIPYRRFGTTY